MVLSRATPTNVSLAKLLYDKLILAEDLEEAGGEITNEQDLIWQNTELAIRDKVDAYGYVLIELNAELGKINELKREATARISKAAVRMQLNIDRLKQRLNHLSEGSPLRGHIHSFHPYISVKRSVDIDLVKDDQAYLTIEIKEADWKELMKCAGVIAISYVPEYRVLKREAKVSQLPLDHPAVKLQKTASVRMT